MKVTWSDNAKESFGSEILEATHNLHDQAIFQDAGLIRILDLYPREDLGIWTFGAHGEGEAPAIRGMAPDASGAEILEAVKRGTIWLNLRRTHSEIPELKAVADEIYDSLEAVTGQRLRKRDMGLLISSPKVHVHYHLDIPLVALFHIRGRKRIWLYPADETHAPSEYVEGIVHMIKEEGLPFKDDFDGNSRIIDLEPGMGLTWPQNAPHRVQNADSVNVSLSCEYMTVPALIKANAIYMNGVLRKQYGLKPQRASSVTPSTFGKAMLARIVKQVKRDGAPKSPTPVTFQLDTSVENCVRPVEFS